MENLLLYVKKCAIIKEYFVKKYQDTKEKLIDEHTISVYVFNFSLIQFKDITKVYKMGGCKIMFKFKMSLLFSNVKFRVALIVFVIAAILAGVVFIPKNKASNISQSVQVFAYTSGATVNGKSYFNIQKCNQASGFDKLFCIEEGQDLWGKTTYNNPKNISQGQDYFTNYNAAMWLVNNMYLDNVQGANAKEVTAMNLATVLTTDSIKSKVAQKGLAGAENVTAKKIFDLRNTKIGNGQRPVNAIEFVEQVALWNYTNNKQADVLAEYKNVNTFIQNTNLSNDQQVTLKYIYYALTIAAENNGGNTATSVLQLDKSNVNFDENSYKVGPYYFTVNGKKISNYEFGDIAQAQIPVSVMVTKKDETVDKKGKELIVKNADGSFYIDLSAYKDNVKFVELRIESMLKSYTTEAYVLDGTNCKNESGNSIRSQHLITVKKTPQINLLGDGREIAITVPEGKYSMILKKVREDGTTVITETPATFKINGNEINTSNGILNIANAKNIENANQVDTYEIVETKAPDGYTAIANTMKVNVKFKLEGKTFVIDRENTTTEGFGNGAKFVISQDNKTITVTVPNKEIPKPKKSFDLSLRKFISKVDGTAVAISREPVINIQSIINLQATGTASYYHVKNSIGVKVGSEVEYTIRVYNEGEILGYAKQITDYLPEGLSFVRIADESKNLYTTTSEVGSKVVVLNYNGNTAIKTLRDFFGKVEVNVTNNYYQEVKIICKVENTNATYITSRSEITNYGYSEKDASGKAVWKEAVSVGNVDTDSAQNTIKGNLDLDNWYENAEERTYIDANGKTVVDKNYYPGVQDDDDFETVELLTGKYNIIIKKVDAADGKTTLQGAYFAIKGSNIDTEVGATSNNGEVVAVKGMQIQNEKQVNEYTIKETKAPEGYRLYNGEIKIKVATKFDGSNFVIDGEKTTVNGKDIKYSINKENTTLTVVVPDVKKEFDLSLRKFISQVNDAKLKNSREPQVDTSKLASGESTTATYNHSKDPVDVNTNDVVTYTLRTYNEGEIDAIAKKIVDDIPAGLEYLPDDKLNKEYKWVMYSEVKSEKANDSTIFEYNGKKYQVTNDASKADIIVTDYLDGSVIKAFDANSKKLDFMDVKAAFKVVEPKTSDRIIINNAQIGEHTDSKGNKVTDRDSTPSDWKDGEDDQDIEKVRVRYFDLALRKWVTKAIVYENGTEKVTETNHGPWDSPEPVVKVDLLNTNINNVTVKFEYTIRVYNQGDKDGAVAGYAKKITDYIPEGLKFVPEDNKGWKIEDGKYVNRELENTLLKPGEYADVKILLTWVNGSNNLGLKDNVAEISEDYNEWGTPDIDSTPDNRVEGEDDIDNAQVILAIRTGGAPIVYTGVAVASLAILSVGIVFIRKKVLA